MRGPHTGALRAYLRGTGLRGSATGGGREERARGESESLPVPGVGMCGVCGEDKISAAPRSLPRLAWVKRPLQARKLRRRAATPRRTVSRTRHPVSPKVPCDLARRARTLLDAPVRTAQTIRGLSEKPGGSATGLVWRPEISCGWHFFIGRARSRGAAAKSAADAGRLGRSPPRTCSLLATALREGKTSRLAEGSSRPLVVFLP